MVKHLTTVKNYLVYNHFDETYYNVELEINHSDLDEETISILDENGLEIENDELFSEVESIWEDYYNNTESNVIDDDE
jgi:hypothetical protein